MPIRSFNERLINFYEHRLNDQNITHTQWATKLEVNENK